MTRHSGTAATAAVAYTHSASTAKVVFIRVPSRLAAISNQAGRRGTIPRSRNLVGPDLEAGQGVWPEGLGDRHIGSVAPLRDQDAADPGHVVARIEGAPVPAEIGLEPAGEIAHGPGFWRADIAEIAGAIARRNVHAAAERDGEMGVIATDALAFCISLPRRPRGARVLVSEGDVTVDEVADRLNPGPARWCLLEQLPGDVRKPVGLAIAAAEQIDQ